MSKPFKSEPFTRSELRFLSKPTAGYNTVLVDQKECTNHVVLSEPRRDFSDVKYQSSIFCKLPIEVTYTIFESMDMKSIFQLGKSSSHLRMLVESWKPYQDIMTNARSAVQAIIATCADELWTVRDLQSQIYTKRCTICGDHGEILHMLKMLRVCFKCVTTERKLQVINPDYALNTMGLAASEIVQLPWIRTIPQKVFWGQTINSKTMAIDYTAAIELATTTLKPSGKSMRLHTSLLNPPESDECVRYACCTYFPVLNKTPRGTTQVKAYHCAGCSFFWNYHNPRPYYCHRLYPHDFSSGRSHADIPQSQLQNHLASCVYAAAFWEYLYTPTFNYRNPNNPNLKANGGHLSSEEMVQMEAVRLVSCFDSNEAPRRHFARHTRTHEGQFDHSGHDNNDRFDEIPSKLRAASKRASIIQCRTELDLELEAKQKAGDPQICAALSNTHDPQLSNSQQAHLARIREAKALSIANNTHCFTDTYGDPMLGDADTQANWALAHDNGSQNIFKTWNNLYERRKYCHAELIAREAGCKAEVIYNQLNGWGMDRWGNVSSLF